MIFSIISIDPDLQDNGVPIYGSLSRPQKVRNLMPSNNKITALYDSDNVPQVFFITLHKQSNGFGFRIIGGAEDNTKVNILCNFFLLRTSSLFPSFDYWTIMSTCTNLKLIVVTTFTVYSIELAN